MWEWYKSYVIPSNSVNELEIQSSQKYHKKLNKKNIVKRK